MLSTPDYQLLLPTEAQLPLLNQGYPVDQTSEDEWVVSRKQVQGEVCYNIAF